MTKTIELDVAQSTLKEIVANLKPDDEVVVVQNRKPVARIVASKSGKPTFGSCKGLLTIVEDDDEHLKDFESYMQ